MGVGRIVVHRLRRRQLLRGIVARTGMVKLMLLLMLGRVHLRLRWAIRACWVVDGPWGLLRRCVEVLISSSVRHGIRHRRRLAALGVVRPGSWTQRLMVAGRIPAPAGMVLVVAGLHSTILSYRTAVFQFCSWLLLAVY